MTGNESLFVRQEHGSNINNLFEIDAECPTEESTYVIISNITNTQQLHDINKISAQVANGQEVKELLDHVNWRIFIYSCEQQSCSNSTHSSYQLQNLNCSNTACCFSDSIDDLHAISVRCGNTSCTKAINSFISQVWFIPFTLGLLCLLGNVVVMCDKAISLRKAKNKAKEIQTYFMLVFNLAFADFLMGVYLTGIAFEMKHKADIGVHFSEPSVCNLLAIVNNVSSQVSLTLIFIISYYRFVGVIYPYKKHQLKFVLTIIISTWFIWLVVAALPIIPFEPLETIFTFGLVKNRQLDRDSIIDFNYFASVFQTTILPGFSNVTEVTSIIHAVTQFPTPSVLEKYFISLGWINLKTDNWNLVGYYDFRYTCSINYFFENETYRNFDFYTLMLLFYNLLFSIATLILYIIVIFKIYKTCRVRFVFCKLYLNCCSGKKSHNYAINTAPNAVRSAENREIFKRILIIAITDVMCWIPLCIASLTIWKLSNATEPTWEENLTIAVPFQTSTLYLVSLNSLVNPYIYSYELWIQFFKKIKRAFHCTKLI